MNHIVIGYNEFNYVISFFIMKQSHILQTGKVLLGVTDLNKHLARNAQLRTDGFFRFFLALCDLHCLDLAPTKSLLNGRNLKFLALVDGEPSPSPSSVSMMEPMTSARSLPGGSRVYVTKSVTRITLMNLSQYPVSSLISKRLGFFLVLNQKHTGDGKETPLCHSWARHACLSVAVNQQCHP